MSLILVPGWHVVQEIIVLLKCWGYSQHAFKWPDEYVFTIDMGDIILDAPLNESLTDLLSSGSIQSC